VVPFGLLPILLYRLGWADGSIILLGLSGLLAACIVKINYHYADPENQYQYLTGSALLFASTMVVETAALACAAKTLPPFFKFSYWNVGLLAAIADSMGRIIGDVSFTAYSYFDSYYLRRAQPFYTYVVNSVVLTLLLMATIRVYPRLERHIEMKIRVEN
jgi:hypothetical protein